MIVCISTLCIGAQVLKRVVKKPEDRKKEIIGTAKALFLKNQYDQTTMAHITKELGIAKGTIYHYFSSKEALLDAIVEDEVTKTVEAIDHKLSGFSGTAAQMLVFLINLSDVTTSQDIPLQELHQKGNSLMHTRLLARLTEKLAKIYCEVIKKGCQQGIFHTSYPLESAELLLAGLQFLTDHGIYPWSPEDLQRRHRAIPGLIEAQLKAKPGTIKI